MGSPIIYWKESKGISIQEPVADKALREAKLFERLSKLVPPKTENFSIYLKAKHSQRPGLLTSTSNNTIFWNSNKEKFQKQRLPALRIMSSDIFSDNWISPNLTLIYAGAQRNMDRQGTTLVGDKGRNFGRITRKIPSMWL